MMSPICAPAVRLFESELLLFALIIERADRGIVIWPIKQHAADDLDARAQCDWVGRKPAGSMHCSENVFFTPNQADVEWIPRNVAAGAGHHRQGSEAGLMLVMAPERRQCNIRQCKIGDEHTRPNHQPSPVVRNPLHPNVPMFVAMRERRLSAASRVAPRYSASRELAAFLQHAGSIISGRLPFGARRPKSST